MVRYDEGRAETCRGEWDRGQRCREDRRVAGGRRWDICRGSGPRAQRRLCLLTRHLWAGLSRPPPPAVETRRDEAGLQPAPLRLGLRACECSPPADEAKHYLRRGCSLLPGHAVCIGRTLQALCQSIEQRPRRPLTSENPRPAATHVPRIAPTLTPTPSRPGVRRKRRGLSGPRGLWRPRTGGSGSLQRPCG